MTQEESFASFRQGLRIYRLQSGIDSGIRNMATDEALLEMVRLQQAPMLIVRAYRWSEPTLSLGVNQQVRDIHFLLNFYRGDLQPDRPRSSASEEPDQKVQAVVRRPTGGRAILHGEDISYAFITNDLEVLKASLKVSYGIYADIVQQALERLSLTVTVAKAAGDKDYLRSPVCFETYTSSDLLGRNGKKLTGSAQLRRYGGLLQHGAAFLSPYGVGESEFSEALFNATEKAFGQPVEDFTEHVFGSSFEPLFQELQQVYAKVSGEILANVSTTSGSHLLPASR